MQAEKDACLLALLRAVIGIPFGTVETKEDPDGEPKKKHKDKGKRPEQLTALHQTVVFTKISRRVPQQFYRHRRIRRLSYLQFPQSARTFQMDQFRRGLSNILVVAAHGIDIPLRFTTRYEGVCLSCRKDSSG